MNLAIANILIRDGVGDGQINYVLEHEIKAIEKCFQAAGINQADLKFTYIIVSKRINTRFFRYGWIFIQSALTGH